MTNDRTVTGVYIHTGSLKNDKKINKIKKIGILCLY